MDIINIITDEKYECAKVVVTAYLITEDGEFFNSSNYCKYPQKVCPRVEGEDYTKCKTICGQIGHAEVNVINLAGPKAKNAILIVNKHREICDDCEKYAKAHGVKKIVVVR